MTSIENVLHAICHGRGGRIVSAHLHVKRCDWVSETCERLHVHRHSHGV